MADRFRNIFPRMNRGDVRALVICILIAGVIWLLRSLTEDATDIIQVPVSYVVSDESTELIRTQTKFLDVEVNSTGFGILGQRYFKRERAIEVPIDVSVYGTGRNALETSRLRSEILRIVGNDRNIIAIRPDSLVFTLSKNGKRSVPVKVIHELDQPDQNFMNSPPTVNPSTVELRGPSLIIDTMQFVPTDKLIIQNDGVQEVRLDLPQGVVASAESVEVSWQVDRLRNTSLKIPVEIPSISGVESISFFPDSVSVSFIGPASVVSTLTPADFKVSCDTESLVELATQGKQRVGLRLDRVPESLKDVIIEPGRVEFLIIR